MKFGPWLLKGSLLSACITAAIALGGVYFITPPRLMPSYAEAREKYVSSETPVLDKNGMLLTTLRTSRQSRNLDWVTEISPVFRELLLKSEDRKFYSHHGVDWRAIAASAPSYFKRQYRRGGSTLTMQLAGLLRPVRKDRQEEGRRKIKQIREALAIEKGWSKDQILEVYVNLVPFRSELVGIGAASQGYFSKSPSALNATESALLVSLLRSPNAAPSRVGERACKLLEEKNCAPLIELAENTLGRHYHLDRQRSLLPVFSQEIVAGKDARNQIQSTLDIRIQKLALMALRDQLERLRDQNVRDGAVIVLDVKSGKPLAYVGNGGPLRTSAFQVDGIQAKRQAGSTLKPFLYATAFDLGILKPQSLLEDSPADIAISGGRVYRPRNYDNLFRGMVTASEALGSSLNVPAVRTLALLGEGRVLDKMRLLGFHPHDDEDFYGPSLALGTVDVTLWELSQAFRHFALDDSPFTAKTRKTLFHILSSPEYRRLTFGMDSGLSLSYPAAVKTGTSKDMRDNWCIGWTARYVVGVWVGNFDGKPMWNVSGITGAAPVWKEILSVLSRETASENEMSYVANSSELLEKRTLTRIRYPVEDMMVGLDPDIPSVTQQLPIEIENPLTSSEIYLDDKLLSEAKPTIFWSPKTGNHHLELRAANGEIVDEVRFHVQ